MFFSFLFRRRASDPQQSQKLAELRRATAFSAGFRCGQCSAMSQLGAAGCPAIVDWELAEAENAVKHGFTMASKFVAP